MANPTKPKAKGQLLQWRNNGRNAMSAVYSDLDAELLRGAIDAATRRGAALMFGITSDGGAFSILVLDGDAKSREYPHGKEECQDLLREIMSHYTD